MKNRKEINSNQILRKRILVIRTDRLGDVILSTPVFSNLRLAYPKSYLAFMCRPYTQEIVRGNPHIDKVIVFDKYGKHRKMRATVAFAREIKREKFDVALILHPTNRVHLIAWLAGIPERVGWNKKLGFLLTKRLKPIKHEGKMHEMEYTLNFLRAWGVPVKTQKILIPVNEKALKNIDRVLLSHHCSRSVPLVVFHASASCVSKRWPQENFSQILTLFKKHNIMIQPVVIASSAEYENGGLIVKEHSNVLDLRGKLSVVELVALLSRAALLVSNDSGPVHIAAGLSVPVISIFGRAQAGLSPLRWRPLGENAFYFHEDAGCYECFAHKCTKQFLCLRKIRPQVVFDLAKKIISGEK